VREFATGATRNNEEGKYDYEGFLSPLVIERFAEYMHKHRLQADGKLRDSDNWQKGMPRDAYMKSGYRHFMDWWKEHRGLESREGIEEALCALLFNVQGYLHEVMLGRDVGKDEDHCTCDPAAVAAALCFGKPMNAQSVYVAEDDYVHPTR